MSMIYERSFATDYTPFLTQSIIIVVVVVVKKEKTSDQPQALLFCTNYGV